MFLLFSMRVAELPPVSGRAVHLDYLSFVKVYQFVYIQLSLFVLRAGCVT